MLGCFCCLGREEDGVSNVLQAGRRAPPGISGRKGFGGRASRDVEGYEDFGVGSSGEAAHQKSLGLPGETTMVGQVWGLAFGIRAETQNLDLTPNLETPKSRSFSEWQSSNLYNPIKALGKKPVRMPKTLPTNYKTPPPPPARRAALPHGEAKLRPGQLVFSCPEKTKTRFPHTYTWKAWGSLGCLRG